MEPDEALCVAVPLPPARVLFVGPLPPGTAEGLLTAPVPASGAPATGNISVACGGVRAGI